MPKALAIVLAALSITMAMLWSFDIKAKAQEVALAETSKMRAAAEAHELATLTAVRSEMRAAAKAQEKAAAPRRGEVHAYVYKIVFFRN